MKRIVFITNSIGYGGAEKMLTYVANSLSERGHKCAIINLDCFSNFINEKVQYIADDISVFTVSSSEKQARNKFEKKLKQISEISDICKEFCAEVIIGFLGRPNMIATIVAKKLGIPSIVSERGDPNRTWDKKDIKDRIVISIINSSKGCVFQTYGAMDFYSKGLQKRSTVIPNPIFIDKNMDFQINVPRKKTIVSFGRFDNNQKRYDVMLNAFKLFYESHKDYVLKLYGSGPDEAVIKQLADDMGISDKVLFMGVSQCPMNDIKEDGIFIITSDFEGISNSLLEAMAIGLPCVSTDHTPGGARMLIENEVNGLLSPMGDYVDLAKNLSRFADDIEFANACGMEAKKVVERFEPSKIIDLWENYILNITE